MEVLQEITADATTYYVVVSVLSSSATASVEWFRVVSLLKNHLE